MSQDKWFRGIVKKGSQMGKKINFPTVNFDPAIISSDTKEGVYATCVKYKNKIYKGALYFGHRFSHDKVLEIYILDFNQKIYDEVIEFQIVDFIRKPMNFTSLEELKNQIKRDIEAIAKLSNCL